MAVELTKNWQTIATSNLNYTYSGISYTWNLALQARYVDISGNSATVKVRAVIKNNTNAYWSGSNKYYNVNDNGAVQYSNSVSAYQEFTTNEYSAGSLNGGSSRSLSAVWQVINYSTTASETVIMPQFIVAPNVPSVSVSNNDPYQNSVTFGTSSFGVPSSGTVYLYGGTSNNPTTQLTSKTTLGNSTYTHTGLSPNTKYYYRAGAKNSANEWSNYSTTISITTRRAVYASYEDKTKLVRKLEAPYNGLARKVLKLYDSDDGKARRIY